MINDPRIHIHTTESALCRMIFHNFILQLLLPLY